MGGQIVSLVSVHGRGSLFDTYSLLHFSLVPVGYTGQYFSVLRGHRVSCGLGNDLLLLFFESLAECSLGFINVCVAAVDVTRDVVDGSTLVFFRCFVFRVYYHRAEGVCRLVIHVYVV